MTGCACDLLANPVPSPPPQSGDRLDSLVFCSRHGYVREKPQPVPSLGKRQRKMLADMDEYGDGGWPPDWRMTNDRKNILASLYHRNLVTEPDMTARLTESGRRLARRLQGK